MRNQVLRLVPTSVDVSRLARLLQQFFLRTILTLRPKRHLGSLRRQFQLRLSTPIRVSSPDDTGWLFFIGSFMLWSLMTVRPQTSVHRGCVRDQVCALFDHIIFSVSGVFGTQTESERHHCCFTTGSPRSRAPAVSLPRQLESGCSRQVHVSMLTVFRCLRCEGDLFSRQGRVPHREQWSRSKLDHSFLDVGICTEGVADYLARDVQSCASCSR